MEKIVRKFNIQLQPSAKISVKQTSMKKTEIWTDSLSLNPAKIALTLGTMAVLLVLANIAVLLADHLTGHTSIIIHKLVKLFYLDLEQNIPSFFSMLILLIASALLTVITILKKKQKASYVTEWSILSIGFFYMAFDEIMEIHDKLVAPLQALLGHQNLGIFNFAWVIPGIILVSFLGIYFLRFFINLPPKTRLWFFIAGFMFVGGSIGLELIEGVIAEKSGMETFSYYTLVTIEETLEMLGVIVFIWALLEYLADNYKELKLKFGASEDRLEIENSDNI
jgi:hypothetical protein